MRHSFCLVFIFVSVLSASSFSKTYEVNGQHSFVNFELDYMKVSEVKGTFDRFEGAFEWDSQKGKLSDVAFQIDVNSINTRDAKRDAHLRRKDFFFVKEFPAIAFIGKEIQYKEGKPSQVTGELTIKDVTKTHSFELDWKGEFDDPVDKKKSSLFLKAETTIDRTDFGITWNKALDQGGWIVGNEVEVEVVIEANPTDARPAFSRFYRKTRKILPGKLEMPKSDGSQDVTSQKKKVR